MNENFARIERLPTYVFAITNELKAKARSKGEDIIDFGMGNPDQPTPQHIVDKLVERQPLLSYSNSPYSKSLRKIPRHCIWGEFSP